MTVLTWPVLTLLVAGLVLTAAACSTPTQSTVSTGTLPPSPSATATPAPTLPNGAATASPTVQPTQGPTTAPTVAATNTPIGAPTAAATATIKPTPTPSRGTYKVITVAASNATPAEKAQADYVATGADDQNAINAAISALPSQGGKVTLSSGTFTISSSILISSPLVTLEGVGFDATGTMGTLVKLAPHADCTIVKNADATSRQLIPKDLVFDGNKANQDAGNWDGIDVSNNLGLGTMADPANVMIQSVKGRGIYSPDGIAVYIFGTFYVAGSDGDGLHAWVQGSNDLTFYAETVGGDGVNAYLGDCSNTHLVVENSQAHGALITVVHSTVNVWAKSNNDNGIYMQGQESNFTIYAGRNNQSNGGYADVQVYNAQNNTINLNIDAAEQPVAHTNGLALQNNVSGNTITGNITSTGYAVVLNTGAADWNSTGLNLSGMSLSGTDGPLQITGAAPTGMLAKGNAGWPSGQITNPIGTATIGLGGSGSVVSASTDYTAVCTDLMVNSTNSGNSDATLTLKDPAGNTVQSWTGAALPAYGVHVPAGYKLNWGAFTGDAPTVTVFGN